MTLRNRNKIILGLFYITFAFFLLYIGLFVFSIITQKLTFPEISNISNKSTFFLFKYSPYAIIVSCFIEVIFSCVILRTIYRSFEKTQSTQILYLSLFFLSIAIDSCRIFIPLFNLNNIFSNEYKPLEKKKIRLQINDASKVDSIMDYAREIVWYGRNRRATDYTSNNYIIEML